MYLKFAVQGLIIYMAMAAYAIALVAQVAGRKGISGRSFLAGFLAGLCALVYRWVHTGHVPMQNLFEVFLWLGALAYPVSLLSKRFIGLSSSCADLVIGLLAFFPAGFIFSDQPQYLPPALQSHFFVPHVLAYMLSYLLIAKAGYWSIRQLMARSVPVRVQTEQAAYQTVCLGLPLMTAGLLLGSGWGHYAWGDWWGWDPKELWSLACWLVLVLYVHLRPGLAWRRPNLCPMLVLTGLVLVLITLLWANLSRLFAGLHSYAV